MLWRWLINSVIFGGGYTTVELVIYETESHEPVPQGSGGPLTALDGIMVLGGQTPYLMEWTSAGTALVLLMQFAGELQENSTMQVKPWAASIRGLNGEWLAPALHFIHY